MLEMQWLISLLITMIFASLGILLFHEILIRRVDQAIAKHQRHLIIFEEAQPWVSATFWLALTILIQYGGLQTFDSWITLNLLLLIFLYVLFMLDFKLSASIYLLNWAYYWFLTGHPDFSAIPAALFACSWILLAFSLTIFKRHRVARLPYGPLTFLIGSVFWIWSALSQVNNQDQHKIAIQFFEFIIILAINYYTVRSINEERSTQRAILRKAMYDRLTNLYNFDLFEQNLNLAYQEYRHHQRPLTMIAIDIDRFKQINDTYGHLFGNQMLQHVSSTLKAETAKFKGTTVYRTGGEEFNILVTGKSLAFTADLASQIATIVAENPQPTPNDQHIKITLSVGVSKLNDSDLSPHGYFHRTDELLYMAKRAGGNQVKLEQSLPH